jgi:tetratricopeptide (TPR) repeat protein
MAIKGSLREASLADVLQLLAMGQKTGCLSVSDHGAVGAIYFDRGRICHAALSNRRDRLGDVLVRSGAITASQLGDALDEQFMRRGQKLGQLLIERGALSAVELERAVRGQIEQIVFFLFTWSTGTFNFEPDVHPQDQVFLVGMQAESLLLEGARRVDEWSLIEKKIPSLDVVFQLDHRRLEMNAPELSREQERLVPLIDGQRDISALADETGLGEFEVGKALYGLAMAGYLNNAPKRRDSVVRVVESLAEESVALGAALYNAAMYADAEEEFRHVLEQRPGDATARSYLGLLQLRASRWAAAASHFEEAARGRAAGWPVFYHLALAYERAGHLAQAREALLEAAGRGGASDPRVLLSFGVIALREGDLSTATTHFDGAHAAYGAGGVPAVWFHYSALVSALAGRATAAVATLRDGLRAHPRAARLYNNLAVALERTGAHADALVTAMAGAEIDPGLAQLAKNIGDEQFRRGALDEAHDAYQRAVTIDETLGPDVWIKLGEIAESRHQHADARRCWERALTLDPGSPAALQRIAALPDPPTHG